MLIDENAAILADAGDPTMWALFRWAVRRGAPEQPVECPAWRRWHCPKCGVGPHWPHRVRYDRGSDTLTIYCAKCGCQEALDPVDKVGSQDATSEWMAS